MSKKAAVKKPAPKKVAAPKKKATVKKPAPKKAVAPKKKVAVRKPTLKKKPLPKKAAPKRKVVVKLVAKKPVPRKMAVAKKPAPKKVPVKKAVAARPAPQKATPKIQLPQEAVAPKKVVEPTPETGVPHSVPEEWIGTSAMKAISCPDCDAKAGELCVSKDADKKIWESHPARIAAYTTSRLASRLILTGQQQAIGNR